MNEDTDREADDAYPSTNIGYVDIQKCAPPGRNAELVDAGKRRAKIREERPRMIYHTTGLNIFADPPGLGKTTSFALGLADRNDPFVIYLPQHRNCREFETDDTKPDVDLHLKGPTQPMEDECMDARVDREDCGRHGDQCPRMCPVYERAPDDEIRCKFEAIRKERGTGPAHAVLSLEEEDWHGDTCAWQEQWECLDEVKSVVTVTNYITEERVNQVGFNIIDDASGYLEVTTELTAEDLRKVVVGLEPHAQKESNAISDSVEVLITFINRLRTELLETDDPPSELETLTPPEFPTEGWVKKRLPEGGDELAETLAWVQHAYREGLLTKGDDSDHLNAWTYYDADDETPFHLDKVFMAAAVAGLPTDSVRRAIGATPGVEECPHCGATSEFDKARQDDDGSGQKRSGPYHNCDICGWSEEDSPITTEVSGLPRALAWIQPDNPEKLTPDHKLIYRELPLVSDLPDPDNTVTLDATPVPEGYALLFDIDPDDITVVGNEPVELNAKVTQIVDGQYHRGTITHDERGERVRKKIQRAIDRITNRQERVIVVGHSPCQDYFDIPDNAKWLSFHAGRGLDFPEYDAVIIVGAPHTREQDFRKDAELLAMDSDVRAGGREHSVREGEDVAEPVYRKYYYEDGTGTGRAVPTKHYTGLTGHLFRNRRENELLQLAHRIRPAIADEEKHIYLLTNVPTELPVETLTTFSELNEPVANQLDIPTNAIEMLETCLELATDGRARQKDRYFEEWDDERFAGTVSDFHELASDYDGPDVVEQSIRNYLDELCRLGLAKRSDEYAQRKGYVYQFDVSTSKTALRVITNNANLEVDKARQLSKRMGTTDWLDWAEKELEL